MDQFTETHSRRTCNPTCKEHEIDWRLELTAFRTVEDVRRPKAERAINFYRSGHYTLEELTIRLAEIAAHHPHNPL